VSADNEADGRLQGGQQLLGRRPGVRVPGQSDRRCFAVLFGQGGVRVASQTVEDVEPAEKMSHFFQRAP
jgi:hypothetical protein